ncbi:DinB family protein [Neobacillus niacini]|uniref:DinB family protein n=1 Tax=Neobacillus niacini TaxID=86668 RepID=UPI002FFE3EE1
MVVYDLFNHWDTELHPATLSCINSLNEEQLYWKPKGWHSSVHDLTSHMCCVEWVWIYRNLLERESWDERWKTKHFESIQDVLVYWNEIHKETINLLTNTPINQLNDFHKMPYKHCPEVSLLWLINHVIEHEIHHRGQIIMLMRMMGVEPPKI